MMYWTFDSIKIGAELAVIAGLLIIAIAWLILRPIRLWYWKRSEEMKLLNSINEKLTVKELESKIMPEKAEEPKVVLEKGDKTQEIKESKDIENVIEEKITKAESEDTKSLKVKTYTEEELYKIIKF